MARKRNPNRDLAYELFKQSKGKLTCKAIAEQLNEKESNIKLWRREDKWINKGGAPKGNKNASISECHRIWQHEVKKRII